MVATLLPLNPLGGISRVCVNPVLNHQEEERKKIKEEAAIPGEQIGLVRRQMSQHTVGRRGGREELLKC